MMAKKGMRWHVVAGGGAVLLFAVLLLIRLGIPEKMRREADRTLSGKSAPIPTGETWLNITQEGLKIGYVRRFHGRMENGFRYEEDIQMRINTMGVVQPLTIRTEAELNPDRTLSSFQFRLHSNLFSFAARGSVTDGKLTVHSGTPGSERQSIIPLAQTPYLGGEILESVDVRNLRAGEERTLPVFDPASLGQRNAHIAFVAEERLTVMGRSVRTRKYAVDFMGMKQQAWIDQEGGIVKETGIMGIALERVVKEEALSGLKRAAGSDLADLAAIPSSKIIADQADLRLMKVRIKGIEGDGLSLDGGRQVWRGPLLTIRKEFPRVSSERIGLAGENLRMFLEPTPFIQSDHPKIRETLKGIISPDDPEEVKARKIVVWIYEHLEKRPVLSVPSAVETLEKGMGDCNEHAVLLAALARAAGIPSQVEAGMVYLRGRFYYHAWNVLFIREWGGWVTADAVMGQMPADVTHIRFVRGAIDRHLDLVGTIGRLKMEILETAK
jgi:hypothetical protein